MDRRDDSSWPDYYARLGVRPSASAEEIRAAYRERAQETHPDHNPDDPEAAERFQEVKEAYRVLRDPERREKYDASRVRGPAPEVYVINQQAPAGCGGYLWRVFAGAAAVAAFFALEALGIWAAGTWTILAAVGGAALVAGLITAAVANRFPDEATDVTLRLGLQRMTMWVDGRTALQLSWTDVDDVRLRNDGWTLELGVPPRTARHLTRIPPVLTTVRREGGRGLLEFDLADTDVRRDLLVEFLHSVEAAPRPTAPVQSEDS